MDSVIPDSEVVLDQASAPMVAQQGLGHIDQHSVIPDSAVIPDDQVLLDEDKYNTPGEMAKAVGHGALKGLITSPGAALVETKVFGRKPEDIRASEEASPILTGVGEAAGLVGGAFIPGSQARILSKAGELASAAVGLGKVAESAPLIMKVGESAVRNAAEMAVYQGSDEVAKKILKDPKAASESAIANVGIASVLGGVGGATWTGAVSPLWKATAGPKVAGMLEAMKSATNKESVALPEAVHAATESLGVPISPVMRGALGDEKGMRIAQELYRAQNEKMGKELSAVSQEVQNRVDQSLGAPLDEVSEFSTKEAGDELLGKVKADLVKEFEGPVAQIKARDEANAKIMIPDENRIDAASSLVEKAVMDREVGTDSRYFNEWQHYGQKLLGKDDVGGVDAILSELFQRARSTDDGALRNQLQKIRNYVGDFKEKEIQNAGNLLGGDLKDVAAGRQASADVINLNADANRGYSQMVKKVEEVMEGLGLGDWRGPGTLLSKLDGLTSEQLIKKFSTKGDVALQTMLQEKYPQWAGMVQQHEMKKFIAPSIKEHMGEKYLDYSNLSKRLDKLRSGQPEYADFIMTPQAAEAIRSAKTINDAVGQIKNIKDSGTPAGLAKVFKHIGGSAIGAIGYLMGHNPISSIMVGEAAQRLGKDAPEAIRFAYLKYLGSDKSISPEGFKAMVDMVQSTYKGENMIAKTTENLFKREAQVLPIKYIPKPQDLEKLDRMVADTDDHPEMTNRLVNAPTSHYMQDQHDGVAATSAEIVSYLKSLKPGGEKLGIMDKELPPDKGAVARYNRALNIAQQPATVIQHIKDGTLLPTDVQDIAAMYPSLYNEMQKQILQHIADQQYNEESPVPYKTRLSMSMFLAQPLDSSMQPASIIAAQPKPKPMMPGMAQPQQNGKPSAMKTKNTNINQTASQQAERSRAARD